MTGGTEEARRLNRALATAAQKVGLGLGVGSQRAMLVDPACAECYRVRELAPDVLLSREPRRGAGARGGRPGASAALVEAIRADALCVHLNAAQELVQDEGDRDFRGCLGAIAAPVERAPRAGDREGDGLRLRARDARAAARRGRARRRRVRRRRHDAGPASRRCAARGASARSARTLREWGIPTAAALVYARRAGSRRSRRAACAARATSLAALALGASAVALALPFLRAHAERGAEGVLEKAQDLCEGLRALMVLTGARRLDDLASFPRVLGSELRAWIEPGPQPPC